jgi:hypothetical protein
MSISSVSFGNNPYAQGVQAGQSSAFQQRRQDFSALQSALGSGDLAGAQKAFASLQQDMQAMGQARGGRGADRDGDNDGSGGAQTGQTGQTGQPSFQAQLDQRKQDFSALQSALSSGDLAGAQKAFASLQQDMRATGKGHHHHHQQASGGNTSGAASVTAISSTQTGGINTTA